MIFIAKRRNTISSIATQVDSTNETNTTKTTNTKKTKSSAINKLNSIIDSDIFELIEKGDLDQLQHKLVFNKSCINRYDFIEFISL